MSSQKGNDLLKALNSQIQHQEPDNLSQPAPSVPKDSPEKQPTQHSKENKEE